MRDALSLMIALATAVGCKAREPSSDVKLIGGAEAVASQFPATVQFELCTGVKIGPRHFLTAAHCVIDRNEGRLAGAFGAGKRLDLRYGVAVAKAEQVPVTVVRTSVHPAYAKRTIEAVGTSQAERTHSDVPDVAVIEVTEETPRIGQAVYDDRTLAEGEMVVLGGYGCEAAPAPALPGGDGSGGAIVTSGSEASDGLSDPRRLKWGITEVYRSDDAYYLVRDLTNAFGEFTLKLCAGDSGGPVYVADAPEGKDPSKHRFTTVVGVNAYGSQATSAFTRIDDASPLRVGGCLKDLLAGRHTPDAASRIPLLCGDGT